MQLISNETALYYYQWVNKIICNKDQKSNQKLGLKIIVTEIFDEIVRDEKRTFAGLYSKAWFVFDKYNANMEIKKSFKLLIQKISKKQNKTTSIDDNLLIAKIICDLIKFFSDYEAYPELITLIDSIKLPELKLKYDEEIESIRVSVIDFESINKTESGKVYCDIFCENPEFGQLKIRLWDHSGQKNKGNSAVGRKFYALSKFLRKYMILQIFRLKKITDYYSTTAETKIILQPDFLFDVTSLAECFMYDFSKKRSVGNPNLYFLSSFFQAENNPAILKGKLVNDLLDEMLSNDVKNIDEIIDEKLKNNILSVYHLKRNQIDEIKTSLKIDHLPNLYKIKEDIKYYEISLEPSFYSEKYGLQGRLDILTESKSDHSKKDIFELKSSKPPADLRFVWENNKMQVIGYNLLLDSVYGKKRHGNSSILYSRANNGYCRNVMSASTAEQQYLMLRNFIVFQLVEISEGRTEILNKINKEDFGLHPIFVKNEIDEFHKIISNLSELETKYFNEFYSFIIRELISGKIGDNSTHISGKTGFSALWRKSREEKIRSYSILCDLYISNFDSQNGIVTMLRSIKNSISDFREGDIVILYPDLDKNPLEFQVLKGNIESLSNNTVILKLWNNQLNSSYFEIADTWAIEHDFFDRNVNSLLYSIFDFVKSSKRKKNLILGIEKPQFSELDYVYFDDVTSLQNEILNKAVKTDDYFLIQGPPGTGKTSAILKNLVKHIYSNNISENIFILAFTNRAVSEICNKLINAGLDFIRLGKDNSNNSLYRIIKDCTISEICSKIEKNRIFVSTVSTFLIQKKDLKNIKSLDTVVIDEASQLLEPHICGILSDFNRFILIGDHKQLPAIATQAESKCVVGCDILRTNGFKDYRNSLFERLFEKCISKGWTNAYATLTEHFRMHNDIAELINCNYDNKLKSYLPRQNTKLDFPVWKSRIQFYSSLHETIETNCHIYEAKKVVELLNKIKTSYKENFNENTVGVITPFRAQIAKIKSLINDESLLSAVTIDTVERFQGSERDIIIMSFAVSHPHQLKSIQSLAADNSVDRKLNVAISRAREQIIFLGEENVLKHSFHYRRLLNKIYLDFNFNPQR